MYEKFNIPYIVGTPFGKEFAKKIVADLKEAIITKENKISYINRKIEQKSTNYNCWGKYNVRISSICNFDRKK